MTPLAPRASLSTHDVFNQPEPLENVNLYADDHLLRLMVRSAGGGAHDAQLSAFGATAGSADAIALGVEANRHAPMLRSHDRYGRRIDEVDFHPAYHRLMAMGLEGGVSARAWTHPAGGHVAHAALLFLMSQADSGVTCPMSMTYAAMPVLRQQGGWAADWVRRIEATAYDPRAMPANAKQAVTIGMAMTEKQGGSDVRANTTRARPLGEDAHELVGHKWFCSAPMSDAFLTLAYADGGLSCFFVPRWRPDGERNGIELQRLKDKLGDRSNASAEIEYKGAWALRVGEEGRGVRTIVEMVNHTRLDCAVGAASIMRQSLSLAIDHTRQRSAFQKRLINQPLMRQMLAGIALEVEIAMALAFRAANAIDRAAAGDADAAALARVLVPIAKYWNTNRCPAVVAVAMEAHGGAGFIEESLLPRLFRASPLNAIWEGSGNVIVLDLLRALDRDPHALEALVDAVRPLGELGAKGRSLVEALQVMLKDRADDRIGRRLAKLSAILAASGTLAAWGRERTAAAVLTEKDEFLDADLSASDEQSIINFAALRM